MPYRTYEEEKGIYWKFFGLVTAKELFDVNDAVYGSPKFDQLHYQIADYLAVTSFEVSLEDAERLAATDLAASLSNPRLKVAMVSNDESILANSGWYKNCGVKGSWESQTFEDLESARQWVKE